MIKSMIFLFMTMLLTSCGGGSSDSSSKKISDIRFNGVFEYVFDSVSSNGINETHLKDTLIFNGSTVASNVRYKKNYNTYSGWSYTGNYIGDSLRRNIEFEVNNNQYRYRIFGADNSLNLWGRDSNQWSNWSDYVFDASGNILSLKGDYANNAFGFDNLVVTKKGSYIPIYDSNTTEVNNLSYLLKTTLLDGSKDYEITWNLSGLAQIKGISYGFNGSYSSQTTMNPLPTKTSITLNPGESITFNIQTIDLEGDYSVGLQITVSN